MGSDTLFKHHNHKYVICLYYNIESPRTKFTPTSSYSLHVEVKLPEFYLSTFPLKEERAYNLENLYSRKSEERFKIFIGFQNKVCTNLCVSTDGLLIDVRARIIAELAKAAFDLFGNFNAYAEMDFLNRLPEMMITESHFTQLVGSLKFCPPNGIP